MSSEISYYSFKPFNRFAPFKPSPEVSTVQAPFRFHPATRGGRRRGLNCLNSWNGLNGCYLPAAGTIGVWTVCKEISGSSRYKLKALTMGMSFTEKRIASSVFERFRCSCHAQLGTAKQSCLDHSSVLSPTIVAPLPPTTK